MERYIKVNHVKHITGLIYFQWKSEGHGLIFEEFIKSDTEQIASNQI